MPSHRLSPPARTVFFVCSLAAASAPAAASCGSAYCTLMTDRYAQGSGEPHVGWSGQIRFEELTQDRLRSGTRNVDAADVTGEDTIERRTASTQGKQQLWVVRARSNAGEGEAGHHRQTHP